MCNISEMFVCLCRFPDPVDGLEYLYTNFEPFCAHQLLPCFDQPDLKGVLTLTGTDLHFNFYLLFLINMERYYELQYPDKTSRGQLSLNKPTYIFFLQQHGVCFIYIKYFKNLSVTAPSAWKVFANSKLFFSSQTLLGTRHSFEPTPSISSYLYAVVAGPFDSFEVRC